MTLQQALENPLRNLMVSRVWSYRQTPSTDELWYRDVRLIRGFWGIRVMVGGRRVTCSNLHAEIENMFARAEVQYATARDTVALNLVMSLITDEDESKL